MIDRHTPRARLLFAVCVLAILSGCRIQVEVLSGGFVRSEDGSFRCGPEGVCEITVDDLSFESRIEAVPDPGNYFVGWDTGFHTLCGGLTSTCWLRIPESLWTNELVLEFIASSEAFFIASPATMSASFRRITPMSR